MIRISENPYNIPIHEIYFAATGTLGSTQPVQEISEPIRFEQESVPYDHLLNGTNGFSVFQI